MELDDMKVDLEYDGEEFKLNVANYELLGQIWKPESEPKYVYVFVHGLGCFVTFKKDFYYVVLENGGAVVACDHIGHGKSQGPRTSCTIPEAVEETLKVINLAKERFPGLPIVVHGHSMGGLITIMTMLTHYSDVADVVKCAIAEAPWISKCPQRQLNWFERKGIQLLHMIAPCTLLPAGVELFSPDLKKEWVEVCDKTPLYSHDLSPRLYFSVEEAQEYVRSHVADWPKEMPFLFLQGNVDALVDAKESDVWVQQLLAQEGVDVTYKTYEKGPHLLLKSPYRPEVCREILGFISEKCHI